MANPKVFETAYMKVMMNLLVAVNLSTRQLLHADETYGKSWVTHICLVYVRERGSTFMTRAKNLLYFLHPISMLTARSLPSPLRPKHENLVSSNELIKIESPAWKIWKADVSSNSRSSERIDEGLKLWQRANIRNASFPNLSRSVVIRPLLTRLTKPSFTLPLTHAQHHSGL